MSVYLISLNEPSDEVWDKVKNLWPGRHYLLTDRMAFIAPEGITVTQDIADQLDMNPDGGIAGIVVELGNYAGFNRAGLAEWVEKVQ